MENFHLPSWSVVCSCTLLFKTEIVLLEVNSVYFGCHQWLAVIPRQSVEHHDGQQLLSVFPKHEII